MSEETRIKLINTLNTIEVKGKDNMAMLLGCIAELEKEEEKKSK